MTEFGDAPVIESWLHGRGAATRDAYCRDCRQFLECTSVQTLHDIELHDVQAFADHLVDLELAPSTRSRKLAAIKSLLRFAHEHGHVDQNVARSVKLPKVKDELASMVLSEADVIRIIALEDDQEVALVLRLLYATGSRVSELCRLTRGDVEARSEERVQLAIFGKGEKSRHVVIEGDVARDLTDLVMRGGDERSPSDPLFQFSRHQVYRRVRAAARRAGIKKDVSPHWLRHAHASHALDRGAPVHLVQQTLGHASLTTTTRYSHARPDESSGRFLSI